MRLLIIYINKLALQNRKSIKRDRLLRERERERERERGILERASPGRNYIESS